MGIGRNGTRQALNDDTLFEEYLPDELRQKLQLAEYNYSLWNIHYPKDWESLKIARRRLGFDEFFLFALAIRRLKLSKIDSINSHTIQTSKWADAFIGFLPYKLTDGQHNAWSEILRDVKSHKVMNRLLQGDVGCGKTAVAAALIYAVKQSGKQSVLMAPTGILAFQHYKTLQKLLPTLNIALLLGNTRKKEKEQARRR